MLSALHPCSFRKLQLSQFISSCEPSATSCAENVTLLYPLCPLTLLADIAWRKLLCCRTQKVSCPACENVSGNNTHRLSSHLHLNFVSFKWDPRIAMIFECLPHNRGKDLIPSGDWLKKTHPTHPQETKCELLSFIFHCQAFLWWRTWSLPSDPFSFVWNHCISICQ